MYEHKFKKMEKLNSSSDGVSRTLQATRFMPHVVRLLILQFLHCVSLQVFVTEVTPRLTDCAIHWPLHILLTNVVSPYA